MTQSNGRLLVNFSDSDAAANYFKARTNNQDDDASSISPSTIVRYAKKMSTEKHRSMIMKEAQSLSVGVERVMEELDAVLAERLSYNEFLRRRAQFWNIARKNLLESAAKTDTDDLETFSYDTSKETQASSFEHSVGPLSSKSSSSLANGSASERLAMAAGGLKKPSLTDYDFSDATMAVIQGKVAIKLPVLNMERPRLEDDVFGSKCSHAGKDPVGVGPGNFLIAAEKPEPPSCVLNNYNDIAAVAAIPAAKSSSSVDMDLLYPPAARGADAGQSDSGRSSKSSGGSLMGSFLTYPPSSEYEIVPTGPIVRGDLGLNDMSIADGTGPVPVAYNNASK